MATSLWSNISNLAIDDLSVMRREQIQQFCSMSEIYNQELWYQSTLDCRFEAGDSNAFSELFGNVGGLSGKTFSINLIRPTCNTVSGLQRRNRKSLIAIPIENGDQETADQFTKIFNS